MKREPIDYNSPLGISKREWTRVLGVNLALLLAVYAVALICTLCGSDLFLLNFHSDGLQRIEETLRKWNMFPIVQTLFAMVEMTLMACYVAKAKPKWWYSLAYFGTYVGINLLLTLTVGAVPPFMTFLLTALSVIGFVFVNWKPKEKWFVYLCRFAICYAVTFILNEGISLFRLKAGQLWLQLPNSIGFALNTAAITANATAVGQKVLDALAADKAERQAARINELERQIALQGVVRYPLSMTYGAGPSPFCAGCAGNI